MSDVSVVKKAVFLIFAAAVVGSARADVTIIAQNKSAQRQAALAVSVDGTAHHVYKEFFLEPRQHKVLTVSAGPIVDGHASASGALLLPPPGPNDAQRFVCQSKYPVTIEKNAVLIVTTIPGKGEKGARCTLRVMNVR